MSKSIVGYFSLCTGEMWERSCIRMLWAMLDNRIPIQRSFTLGVHVSQKVKSGPKAGLETSLSHFYLAILLDARWLQQLQV